MNKTELAIAGDLLDKASDQFCNHGCNDYPLPNTDEHWLLFQEMNADNEHKTLEEWQKTSGLQFSRPDREDIFFSDWWLMRYLGQKLLKEVGE